MDHPVSESPVNDPVATQSPVMEAPVTQSPIMEAPVADSSPVPESPLVAKSGHPWIKVDGEASDKPNDIAVLSRMKQFRAMNKLKKLALKVIAENLSAEEIQGLKSMFTNIDTHNSGTITYEELKTGLA